mmetsp:Transcript_26687/g.45420  ORF Transcript_26687/g.45420 Transcript_26687/m.45420 type:complete len:495 (+) Transcript_26687:105-1589(+)
MDSSIQNRRLKANDLARRSSDDFCKAYGQAPLDLIAPFERDEIIIGRRVGSGSFSFVYEIQTFHLRPDQSDIYTEEQVERREATARSVNYGAKYVMKCLKDELEHSEDEDLFIEAAQDIAHEAEMLAAVSHPNIVKLHGVIANRHDAFLDGASSFFIILERLESTLSDRIEVWAKEKNSFNPKRSLKSLSSSFATGISGHSSSGALDKLEKDSGPEGDDAAGSIDTRIRIASFLAGAVEHLHSQGIIFHDLKPDNVGFDMLGNLKLFDFGLARFMPQYGDAYEDLYEMSGAGTPRFCAPEVFFEKPYNLKADVYSFGVVLWEIMCLKKPFAKCKHRKEFEKALKRVDKVLAINRKWPRSIQDPIRRSLSGDHAERPTMREVCNVLNDCVLGLEDSEFENTDTTSTLTRSKSFVLPSRLSSKGVIRKFGASLTSAVSSTPIKNDHTYRRHLSETSGTGSTIGTFEDFLLQESEKKEQEHEQEQSLHSLQADILEV